jgi:hypothetical protein
MRISIVVFGGRHADVPIAAETQGRCPDHPSCARPIVVARRRDHPQLHRANLGLILLEITGSLLPAKVRYLRDAIKALERENRIRKLIRTAVWHGAGQRQKFLLHRLRVGERDWLAARIDVEPLMDAIVGRDRHACAKRMRATDLETFVLRHVKLVGECVDRGIAQRVVIVPTEAP